MAWLLLRTTAFVSQLLPSSPNFDPPAFHLSLADIRWPIAAEWRNGRNGEYNYIGNHHRSFEWYHRWPLTTSPSPKWGPKCTLMIYWISNGRIAANGSSDLCLVLGRVFSGRRIELRYFRFDQIQDGGHEMTLQKMSTIKSRACSIWRN